MCRDLNLPKRYDDAIDFEFDAVESILELRERWEKDSSSILSLEVYTDTSFDLEFERALDEDFILVPFVFILMGVFTAAVFYKRDPVLARSMMGFGAVVSVLLSLMSGYGILFIIGVPFTSLTQILPFILFGTSVPARCGEYLSFRLILLGLTNFQESDWTTRMC